MDSQGFRTEMMMRIRAFDRWSYKDQLENKSDCSDLTLRGWWDMFTTFVEDDME